MIQPVENSTQRVLIVSSHPLFSKGLNQLLSKRQPSDVEVLGLVTSIEEAVSSFAKYRPDLVIIDYDDELVNRDDFLACLLKGEGQMRVVLLSLKEGGSEATVYDRFTLAASNVDDWLIPNSPGLNDYR